MIAIRIGQRAQLGRGRAVLAQQQIEADVIGRWAVHLTWDIAGEDYSVTHVPSGLVLADRMTRKQAVELARLLSLSLDLEHIDRDLHREIAAREVRQVGGRFLTSTASAPIARAG